MMILMSSEDQPTTFTAIELHQSDGITNYIHMIGSGHLSEFLSYYRNLYIHSQQEWEHFNSFLKVYFFRRTMRGGGKGGYSKIQPLARWLACRMIWMSGTNYKEMLESLNLKEFSADIDTTASATINENVSGHWESMMRTNSKLNTWGN
jgi:hypothetical protein